ncbi:hypothetical protein B0H19DRAFT_1256418 [Mycena capillaripes]|nr:hypothetical protein B0H19DRAFT_1256418 [Mycena capillaripes]
MGEGGDALFGGVCETRDCSQLPPTASVAPSSLLPQTRGLRALSPTCLSFAPWRQERDQTPISPLHVCLPLAQSNQPMLTSRALVSPRTSAPHLRAALTRCLSSNSMEPTSPHCHVAPCALSTPLVLLSHQLPVPPLEPSHHSRRCIPDPAVQPVHVPTPQRGTTPLPLCSPRAHILHSSSSSRPVPLVLSALRPFAFCDSSTPSPPLEPASAAPTISLRQWPATETSGANLHTFIQF